jgi:hypothetical protein
MLEDYDMNIYDTQLRSFATESDRAFIEDALELGAITHDEFVEAEL